MSVKRELNLTAAQISNLTNSYESYLKLIENTYIALKEDYSIENVVGLCRKEAEKGKFSYNFKINCADYYFLSSYMIEKWVQELAIKLRGPDYKFDVVYDKISAEYDNLVEIVVIINWF